MSGAQRLPATLPDAPPPLPSWNPQSLLNFSTSGSFSGSIISPTSSISSISTFPHHPDFYHPSSPTIRLPLSHTSSSEMPFPTCSPPHRGASLILKLWGPILEPSTLRIYFLPLISPPPFLLNGSNPFSNHSNQPIFNPSGPPLAYNPHFNPTFTPAYGPVQLITSTRQRILPLPQC